LGGDAELCLSVQDGRGFKRWGGRLLFAEGKPDCSGVALGGVRKDSWNQTVKRRNGKHAGDRGVDTEVPGARETNSYLGKERVTLEARDSLMKEGGFIC